MSEPSRKRIGRPPAGAGGDAPLKVADYPKITSYITPRNKARLKAASTLMGVPEWRLLEQSFETYWKSLPAKDRKLADAMVKRMVAE